MKSALIALSVLALGPSADAAQTLTCLHEGAQVTCRTKQPLTPEEVEPKRCSALEAFRNPQLCRARAIAANRKAVTDMIAAGDCPGAIKAALGLGDLNFARQVRDYCTRP